MSNSHVIFTMIQSYAPNEDAKSKCTDMLNQMKEDSLGESEIFKHLVNVLSDGLNHGNWPWLDYD